MYQHFLHSCLRSKAHAQGKKHFSFMVQDMVATKKSPHKTDTMCSFPLSLSFSHMWAFVYISNTCERRSIGKRDRPQQLCVDFFFFILYGFFFCCICYALEGPADYAVSDFFILPSYIYYIYIYIYITHVRRNMYRIQCIFI